MKSIVLAFLLLLLSFDVWASCGAASCPVDTRSLYETHKGLVRLRYSFEYLDQNQPRIGTRKASVGEISGHHDEIRTTSRVHRFGLSGGVTNRLTLDVSAPLISRSHRHVHHHHGDTLLDGWDFTGWGDLAVQARYAVIKPTKRELPIVTLIAGVEAPTGKFRIANDEGSEAEPGITPGSHSWDYIAGLSTLQHFSVPMLTEGYGLFPLYASLTHQWNGKGVEDYRLGRELSANLGVTYPLCARFGIMTQLNWLIKTEDERGQTFEEVEKTGGEYLFISPGLQGWISDSWDLYTLVQIPLRQRVNTIQLTADYHLVAGLSYKFQL